MTRRRVLDITATKTGVSLKFRRGAQPSLLSVIRQVRKSKSRKVNAYVTAVVWADHLATRLRRRLIAMAQMKARYEALLIGRTIKAAALTGGQKAEALRLLRTAGFDPAVPMLDYSIKLPAMTYFERDGS